MRRLAYAVAFLLVIGLAAAGVFTRSRPPDGKALLISAAQAMEEARSVHVFGHGNVPDATSPSGMRLDPEQTELWDSVGEWGTARRDVDHGNMSTWGIDLDKREEWYYHSDAGILYVADLTPVLSQATAVVRAKAEEGLHSEAARVPKYLRDIHESVQVETRDGRRIAVITYTGMNELAPDALGRELAERYVFEVDMATNHLLSSKRYVRAEGSEEQLLETTDRVEYDVPIPTDIPEGAKVVTATAEVEETDECRSLVMYADGEEIVRSDQPR